jgi:DNA-binding GntR family transcriptional regulator
MEVRRDCMREQIRKELVKRILDGTYVPGERLVELQIAREFHSSQGPVREALRELEALRLVESQTYRGTRVRSVSDREMTEAADVRGVLEEEAARLASASFVTDSMPLRSALELIRAAARGNDLDEYARSNMEFHRRIVEASGNGVLLRVWDSLMLEVRTRINLTQRSLQLVDVAETHVPIVEALARGDGAEAGRLLREHAWLFGRRIDAPRDESANASKPGQPGPAARGDNIVIRQPVS